MASRISLTKRGVLSSTLGLILAGCGAIPETHPIAPDERGLKELGQAYRVFVAKTKRWPKNLKELNIKGQQYPIAVEMINSGVLIVQWGAPLSDEAGKSLRRSPSGSHPIVESDAPPSPEGESATSILAYIRSVPEQGGIVLMDDGLTLRKLTPDEFKTAAKAGSR